MARDTNPPSLSIRFQLSSSIAAAASKNAAVPDGPTGAPSSASIAELRFVSPFNTRVGTSHGRRGGGAAGESTQDDLLSDDEEEEEAALLAGAAADADDDQEVIDRAKLKKMSEKMMRFRAKTQQLPGMLGGQQIASGLPAGGGGTKAGNAGGGRR
jgi:hypothetical protein